MGADRVRSVASCLSLSPTPPFFPGTPGDFPQVLVTSPEANHKTRNDFDGIVIVMGVFVSAYMSR